MVKEGGFPYEPDYATPPGWIVEEYLEVRGMTTSELADLCWISPEHVDRIVVGKAPVGAGIATRFEEIFGLNANVWLRMEAKYRDGLEQGKRVPDFKKETAI